MPLRNFSPGEVIKGLGFKRGQLSTWLTLDMVKPTVKAEGQGSESEFSRENTCQVALFIALLKKKFNRKTASAISFSEKTAKAFKAILSHTGDNYLNMLYLGMKLDPDNPPTEPTIIKMVFIRVKDEWHTHIFHDEKGLAYLFPEIKAAPGCIYVVDANAIVMGVLKGFQKAGIKF